MSLVKYLRFNIFARNYKNVRCFCDKKSPEQNSTPDGKSKKPENEKVKLQMENLLTSMKQKQGIPMQKLKLATPEKKEKVIRKSPKETIGDHKMRKEIHRVASLFKGSEENTINELSEAVHSHSKGRFGNLLENMKVSKAQDEMPSRKRIGAFTSGIAIPVYKGHKPIDLFGSPPLDWFPTDMEQKVPNSLLSEFDACENVELRTCIRRAPLNAFEELIQWTEDGKLWKFPIDNEIGMAEEKQNSFVDHIFVERHIQDWVPKSGPVKDFMELVCVGLSKNPYLTVERKKRHLDFYKDYFNKNKELLKESEAM